jgi:hypothetical protein
MSTAAPAPPASPTPPSGQILVVGDSAIDWYEEQIDRAGIRAPEPFRMLNLQLRGGWKWHEVPGGALLLDRMLHRARARVISPMSKRDPDRSALPRVAIDGKDRKGRSDRDRIVHSLSVIRQYEIEKKVWWRVVRYLGFSIDDHAWDPSTTNPVKPTVLDFRAKPNFARDGAPAIVLVDDVGNGFRDANKSLSWKAIEDAAKHQPVLILKLGQAIYGGNPYFRPLLALHGVLEQSLLFRAGLWLVLAIAVSAAAWRARETPAGAFVVGITASGIVYVLTYFAVGVASDFRYAYWCVLATLAAAVATLHARRDQRRQA